MKVTLRQGGQDCQGIPNSVRKARPGWHYTADVVKRRTLDRTQVIAAARDLANTEGLTKLTMRALSARVGVEAASLYTHVKDKEDLFDGLAELIFSEVVVEATDDPLPRRIEMYSAALRNVLLANANLAAVVAIRPVVSVSTLALVEQALTELTDAGLDHGEALHILDTLISFVVGHALSEIGRDPERGGHSEADLAAQRAALPADLFPNVIKTLGQGPIDRDAEFHYGVRLIMAGIDAALDRVVRRRTGRRSGVALLGP